VKKEFGTITAHSLPSILDAVDLVMLNPQSMIFVPEKKAIYLSLGSLPAASGTFVRFELSRLLGGKDPHEERGRPEGKCRPEKKGKKEWF
jgi:hypothetical protein